MPWDFWLIFLVLALVLPWRGCVRMKKLLAIPHVGSMERFVLYASTIAFQWLAVSIVAWRALAHGFTAVQLGLVLQERTRIAMISIAGAAAIAIFQWLNMRRLGRLAVKARAPLHAIAERVLPQTSVELLPYFALALTAGLCEEFLYRGFAVAVLTRAHFAVWVTVLLSSVLFALAHLYQGRSGLLGVFLIGTIFGIARIAYNSLVPVIFWHTALDLAAGVAWLHHLKNALALPQEAK